MSENKRYYWLKLQKDFFKRHDIRIIEEMENGKDYIIFYLKLLTESISHEGQLRFSDTIPYDDKMLATITNTNIDIVRSAVKVFQSLHLMELWDDKTVYMTETQKMIGSESRTAQIMRVRREEEKEIKLIAQDEKSHIPYIETYTNNKRYGGNYYAVFNRDNQQCASCGSKQKLCVHHIIGYDENDRVTIHRSNLITLCRTCHAKEHGKPTSIVTKKMLSNIKFDFDLYDRIYTISRNSNNVTSELQEVTQEIEKELELDKDIDKEKKNIKKENIPKKQKYGEFENVLLTDEEYKKLEKAVNDRNYYIENVSAYIEQTGKKYKSHYATILNWHRRDVSEGKVPKEERKLPENFKGLIV